MGKSAMKCVLMALLGVAALATAQTLTEEKDKPATPSAKDIMAQWAELNAPGPHHQRFKEAAGKWKTEMKMWMGPGEPTVSPGASTMELVFDGRYLKEHYRCLSTEMPFEGMQLMGYDNIKKKHVSVWIDSMSTGITQMEGTYDEATKTLTMTGQTDDPITGPTKMRSVTREVSKDKCVMEMYQTGHDGKEQKCMEVTYTRES